MTEPWTPRRCAAARVITLRSHGLLVRCANRAVRDHDYCRIHVEKTAPDHLLRPPWDDTETMQLLETAAREMATTRDATIGRPLGPSDNYVLSWSTPQRWGHTRRPRWGDP